MDVEKLCPHCLSETDMSKEKCIHCGKNPKELAQIKHHLKPFTILQGKYLVGGVLGEGGFGITYLGLDINLEMKVAIKEFFPNGFCTRDGKTTTEISAYSGDNMEDVTKWRDSFIKEARSLAKCAGLSGVVGVKDFFAENFTAYIVEEYLEGMTLKDIMKASGGKIAPDQLIPAMEPVMKALYEVHKHGIIHRDISPDNIMRLKNGQMKLLDFGAAREFVQDNEKSLSVLLKHGYAPEEQYRTKGNQGPWSDVYALAGTMYKCLTGITPPEALERLRNDELRTPSSLGVKLKPNQEAALMKAMAVLGENRYQTVEEFRSDFYAVCDTADAQQPEKSQKDRTQSADLSVGNKKPDSTGTQKNKDKAIIITICSVVGALILTVLIFAIVKFASGGAKVKVADAAEESKEKYEISESKTEDDANLQADENFDTGATGRADADSVLMEYVNSQGALLKGNSFGIDLELFDNGYNGQYNYSKVGAGPIDYLIKDFDRDNEKELLFVSTCGSSLDVTFEMYEYDPQTDGVVRKASYPIEGLWFGDSGYIEVLSPNETNSIVMYTYSSCRYFADGIGINYYALKYNGDEFVMEDQNSYSGSDGMVDIDFFNAIRRYASSMEWDGVFGAGQTVGSECEDADMIAKILFLSGRDFLRRNANMEDYTKVKLVGYSDKGYLNDGILPSDVDEQSHYNASPQMAQEDESYYNGYYYFPNSDTEYITTWDLDQLTAEECRIARNEILARHGRKFKSADLQSYFDSQPWYYGCIEADEFVETKELNSIEIDNMYFIKDYENSHGYN